MSILLPTPGGAIDPEFTRLYIMVMHWLHLPGTLRLLHHRGHQVSTTALRRLNKKEVDKLELVNFIRLLLRDRVIFNHLAKQISEDPRVTTLQTGTETPTVKSVKADLRQILKEVRERGEAGQGGVLLP